MRRRAGYAAAAVAAASFALLVYISQWSRGPQFTAAWSETKAAPLRIVLYGDSRPTLPVEFWRDDPGTSIRKVVIDGILAERPDLILHSGDLVTSGSSAGDWARFDGEHAPLRESGIPFYPVPGNHEYYGLSSSFALSFYFDRFPRLANRRWYSLRAGPVLFLMLDTNLGASSDAGRRQDAWYLHELAAATADASIRCVTVIGHHSPYTNAFSHAPDEGVQRRYVEPAKAHPKAKLFVTGHVHAYERFEIGGRTFVVSGGGGAPLFSLKTGEDALFRDAFAGGHYRDHHYCVATLGERRLTVDVMMLDKDTMTWRLGDGFSIDY